MATGRLARPTVRRLSNLSVFRDRCEDVTPRLSIELGLIDRHENVANRFRARARAINWTQGQPQVLVKVGYMG